MQINRMQGKSYANKPLKNMSEFAMFMGISHDLSCEKIRIFDNIW